MQEIIKSTNKILDIDICDKRAENNFIYSFCLEVTRIPSFSLLFSICIVLNTIVLAFDRYPADIRWFNFIEWTNIMFFFMFFFEMIIKMLGLGLKIYFKDMANLFDFIVVLFSTADLLLT